MVFLLIVAIIVVFVGWKTVIRGKRFVRAYIFLEQLDISGCDVAEANLIASGACSGFDPDMDKRSMIRAKTFATQNTSGKQLPVIEMAKNKGFLGELSICSVSPHRRPDPRHRRDQ